MKEALAQTQTFISGSFFALVLLRSTNLAQKNNLQTPTMGYTNLTHMLQFCFDPHPRPRLLLRADRRLPGGGGEPGGNDLSVQGKEGSILS